jgi:hypothetical protein
MTALVRRVRRRIAPLLIALSLVAGLALSPSAHAQRRGPNEPTPEESASGSSSGRSLDGYLGTLVLVLLAFFIVGKSARR